MLVYFDNLFQFLYGTIKSGVRDNDIGLPPHFNSSMVQLKENGLNRKPEEMINFNSSMVQLKVETVYNVNQFSNNFNSSMVQLKGNVSLAGTPAQFHFNSSMVQLKADFSGFVLLCFSRISATRKSKFDRSKSSVGNNKI